MSQTPNPPANPPAPPANPQTDPPANPQTTPPPPAPPANPQTATPPAQPPADPGFPADTPVAQMKPEQQAAYWQHQSRKHEGRATEWQKIAGDKTPEQLKADIEAADKLRKASMTDQERAVAEAKEAAGTTAAITAGESGARVALEIALGHDPEKNDRSALIDTLDLRKMLTEQGAVDAAKVRALAAQLAPTGKESGSGRHDFGAGRRGGAPTGTGVAAGREMYEASRRGKTNSTT